MPVSPELAEHLTGEWKIGLFEAPIQAPVQFCYGCCCVCCMAGQQRGELLDLTGEPYICCAGLCCECGPLAQPQDRNCLWLEACCCPGLAVAANRYIIQTRFDRMNTPCDDCILWTLCMINCARTILDIIGQPLPQEVDNIVDLMNNIVDGCMLAQQQVEIEEIKKNGYMGYNPALMEFMPPQQQNMLNQYGKPGGGAGMAMAGGMAMGMAAGGAAGYAMGGGGGGGGAPQPQVMGAGGGGGGGFMSTQAPNGRSWADYCGAQQVQIDGNGMLAGAWGECMAWAKVFEVQNPGWDSMPQYRDEGPCGQVLNSIGGIGGPQAQQAAEILEQACDQAVQQGRPLPIINRQA
eukprot:gnl/TRDRNA2_/TRDRNA2_168700_c1_seq1.p1 gnl/TRDRNA2_/TRDRNA2_168700_c1~~gnl/TRDRNA2_/TRDRNA2_168700_c1_seq1.p1  ORF type:complete len:349 (+),score=68.24 gnl/TRDRNA2_/TRDRNA2_168700_c1_seq1:108-1154(+)